MATDRFAPPAAGEVAGDQGQNISATGTTKKAGRFFAPPSPAMPATAEREADDGRAGHGAPRQYLSPPERSLDADQHSQGRSRSARPSPCGYQSRASGAPHRVSNQGVEPIGASDRQNTPIAAVTCIAARFDRALFVEIRKVRTLNTGGSRRGSGRPRGAVWQAERVGLR